MILLSTIPKNLDYLNNILKIFNTLHSKDNSMEIRIGGHGSGNWIASYFQGLCTITGRDNQQE